MSSIINYQRIYEEDISETTKSSLELADRYFELTNNQRLLVDDLIDAGHQSAIESALDQEVLEETAALAADMGTQLYTFANVIQGYINSTNQMDSE